MPPSSLLFLLLYSTEWIMVSHGNTTMTPLTSQITNTTDSQTTNPAPMNEKPAPPGKVENVTAIAATSSMFVSWDAPEPNKDITHYVVYYGPTTSPSVMLNARSNKTNLKITGLNPWTEYSFSISACTVDECGSNTSVISNRTLSGIPGKPEHVSAIAINRSTILVSWDAPTQTNGIITHYLVQYEPGHVKRSTTNNETNINITNLKPWTEYSFNVSACISSECGNITSAISNRTLSGTPGIPRMLTGDPKTNSAIWLSWNVPNKTNGIITHYVVHESSGNLTTAPVQKQSNETYMNITGLQPWTVYSFSVSACIQLDCGNNASVESIRTLEGMPKAPNSIFVNVVNESHVVLKWTEPKHPLRGNITTYTVGNTDMNNNTSEINVTDTFVQAIGGLRFWHRYTFFVYAYTIVGPGPKITIIAMTDESIPTSPVRNITTRHKTADSIHLAWEAPSEPNGIIINYIVRYSFKNHVCYNNISSAVDMHKNVTTTENQTNVILSSLYAYWDYNITITPTTAVGEGQKNATFSEKTVESYPGNISEDLVMLSTTPISLNVMWSSPCYPNGKITSYDLQLRSQMVNKSENVTTEQEFIFNDLRPFTLYKFTIRAWTSAGAGNYTQWKEITTNEAAPFMPSNVTAEAINSTSMTVKWQQPSEKRGMTDYAVKTFDNVDKKDINNTCHTNKTSCIITELDEYWRYRFKVVAITGDLKNESEKSGEYRTAEGSPGDVTNYIVRQEMDVKNPRMVFVSWSSPQTREKNGKLTSYYIIYQITPNGTNNIEIVDPKTSSDEASWNYTEEFNVVAETKYIFTVFASTSAGNGTKKQTNISITTGAPFIETMYNITTVGGVSEPQKQIAVTVPNTHLCDCTQGKPNDWGVVVVQDEAHNGDVFRGSRNNFKAKTRYNTWNNVHMMDLIEPYISSHKDWSPCQSNSMCPAANTERRKRDTDQSETYIVGEDGDCGGDEYEYEYCNGYLQPGRRYRVKFYVCTDLGCTETAYSSVIKTDPVDPADNDITGAVVGGVLFAMIVIAAAGVVFFLKRREMFCFSTKGVPFSGDIEMNRGNERPIRLTNFLEHVAQMKRDSNLKFAEEYRDLKDASPQHPCLESERMANRIKNRYTNILPYDHSRVKLLPLDDEEGSDYTNANYMPGYNSQREYIAAQGPLPGTKDDLWRMVWEQNVHIIVMLTQLKERGKVKCEKYWPDQVMEPVFVGDLIIQMQSESVLPDYTIRVIELKLGDEIHQVFHFGFLKWDDFTKPEFTEPVINLITSVRRYIHPEKSQAGPILVHCSAGVGRTGTFICVDHLIQYIRHHDDIDIFGTVYQLRNNRPNMVQTEDQYVFIHDCMKDYMLDDNEEEDEEESVYNDDPGEEALYQNVDKL